MIHGANRSRVEVLKVKLKADVQMLESVSLVGCVEDETVAGV